MKDYDEITKMDKSKASKMVSSKYYNEMTGKEWGDLLRDQPSEANRADWDKINNDGGELSLLIRDQPQLAKHADFSRLTGYNWSLLLRDQPQLSKHADWSKLNGDNWSWLLKEQPQLEKYKPKNMSETSTMPKMSLLREINEGTARKSFTTDQKKDIDLLISQYNNATPKLDTNIIRELIGDDLEMLDFNPSDIDLAVPYIISKIK